jgi:hypothetical protein
MQSKHNLFKYSFKEAMINLIKIKSSDQMFTACVLRTKLPIALNQFQILIMSVPEKIPIGKM